MKKKLSPTHPGEILLEEFLQPLAISQYRLAKELAIPQTRVSKLVKGERNITPDTALRLGRFFNMSAEFWINLQAHYDLQIARTLIGKTITKQIHPFNDAA
ncbi:MAG: HigA family addiction module antidote protein [Legionellales bacterium]|nr:HigA family addiction module antidote protein [Legionellales bacterium]